MYFNPQETFRKQPILFIDKLTDNDFNILINDGESIKSDVLKMSYPKQITNYFNEFMQSIDPNITIITGAWTSKNCPTPIELGEIIDSELFFTDLVGAVWLFYNGINQFEVKEWK
jgi:hypothetical protein